MDFDERSFLTDNKRFLTRGEREIAVGVFKMKTGAYEAIGGGMMPTRTLGEMPFVWLERTPAAKGAISASSTFTRANPNHEMRYAWDTDVPSVIQETGKLSRPITRFDLTFVVSEKSHSELSLWFDIIKMFYTLQRIVRRQRIMIITEEPRNNQHLAELLKTSVAVIFDDQFHTQHLKEELERLEPYMPKK